MMAQNVTIEECKRMRELYADGNTYADIAETLDRANTTVKSHCDDLCRHAKHIGSYTVDEAMIYPAVTDLADKIGRIPSRDDWNGWDDRPCDAATARNVTNRRWNELLKESGLPEIRSRAPKTARRFAYENPHMTGGFDEPEPTRARSD